MATITSLARLSDEDLLHELRRLASCERDATARLVACLTEVDARRLYLALGYTSLFKYCTDVLRLSEDATYARIEVARAAKRYPCLVDRLASGELSLTAIRLLAPHLDSSTHAVLLEEARHKGTKEVQAIIARHKPKPPVPASMRKLPVLKPVADDDARTTPGAQPHAVAPPVAWVPPTQARRSTFAPLSEEMYKVQFTIRRAVHDKVTRLQDLLRHQIPKGDLAVIFERGVELQLADALRKRTGAAERPRASKPTRERSRHIPSQIKRAVWTRDGGACAFQAADGRRCAEKGRLEYHHVVPFAAGGKTILDNIELRCSAHNRYEAEQYFGEGVMSLFREPTPAYA